MARSMTGFATLSQQVIVSGKDVFINLEGKTVNSRYFEVTLKIPPSISILETKISTLARQKLARGKLFLSVNITSPSFAFEKVTFSKSMVEQYIAGSAEIGKALNLDSKLSMADILRLPGVITLEKSELDSSLEEKVLTLLTGLLDKINESRDVEGAQLKVDLEERIFKCTQAIEKIELKNNQIIEELKIVVSQLQAQTSPDSTDSEEKKALLSEQIAEANRKLDKADVNEEIVRFKSHLKNCFQTIFSSEPEQGKQLDFLCQELYREINTVCSKSQDLEMVQAGVDAKVELEKIKEQVQNLV